MRADIGFELDPTLTRTRLSPDSPQPSIRIDYDVETYPFPPSFYLRRQDLQTISTLAQDGKVIEIVGGDGDGKSTLTEELERYIRHHKGQVARIDIRNFLTANYPPQVLENYLPSASIQTGKTRPILIIDNADGLYFRERMHGKTLVELKASRRLGKLAEYEVNELEKMELKEAYIDWLIQNRERMGIVLTAHDVNTPAFKDYQDYGLRRELENELHPSKDRVVYAPYTLLEATEFLKHLGITNPNLIEIVTGITLSHKELKAIACLRISGRRIQEVLSEGLEGQSILPSTKQTFARIIRSWLDTAIRTR